MNGTDGLNPTSAALWILPEVIDLAPQTLNIWVLKSGVSSQRLVAFVAHITVKVLTQRLVKKAVLTLTSRGFIGGHSTRRLREIGPTHPPSLSTDAIRLKNHSIRVDMWAVLLSLMK